MAFGRCPVASFRQRTVYKTEFDIFKQNTEIDLLSLVSYEEHDLQNFDHDKITPKTDQESRIRTREYGNSYGLTGRTCERNRSKSAFGTGVNQNRKYQQNEKRRTWTKSDTGIYKDFARTSKTFLMHKNGVNCARKENTVNRDCKSALEVRPPTSEERLRSQTSCGFHTNDRNRIKSGKTNVPNTVIANKGVRVKSQINPKTDKSILNHIWRTRSAPVRVQAKTKSPNKRQVSSVKGIYTDIETKQKRLSSDHSDTKEGLSPYSESYSIKVEEHDNPDTQNSNFSPVSNGINDENETVNNIHNEDDISHTEPEDQTKWYECVENENVTCIVAKTNASGESGENDKETVSLTHFNEDGGCSKDSGFDSTAVSPELEFCYKRNVDSKEELNEENHKRVKFSIQNLKDGDNGEQAESCSVVSENGDSVTLSETEIESEHKEAAVAYDIIDLISDLERIGANSRLSVISTGGQSNITAEGDTDSLSGDVAQRALRELREAEQKKKIEEEKKDISKSKDLESMNMSKEARHAIMETLQDMGTVKGKRGVKERDSADIRHKGVNAQRRQKDNRNKYEYYMRERSISYYKNHFKSIDSVGNEDNSSAYSSPREIKECDDTSSEEYVKGKLFPSIRENTKLSKTTTNSTVKANVLTLDQAKKKKYKIPGIGNYHLIASPDNDFEITPPGFDSRYNPRPIISKEEMEIPPRFIRERSIQKCKSWLTNVNMSPMSLKPLKGPK